MIHRVASFLRLPPLLAAALLVLLPNGGSCAEIPVDPPKPTPARTFDPSDLYFQGYLTTRDAETLEAQGDLIGADEKLKRAKEMFDAVKMYYPNWKPDMVKDRAAMTNDTIAKIRPKADELRLKKQRIVAELEGGVKTSGEVVEPGQNAKPLGTVDVPKPLSADSGKAKPEPNNSAPKPLQPTPTPAAPPLKPLPVSPIRPVDPAQNQKLADLETEVLRLQKQLKDAQQAQQRNPDITSTARAESRARDLELQRDQIQREHDRAQAELRDMRARLAAAPVESDYSSLAQKVQEKEQERVTLNRALTQSRSQLADEQVKNETLRADVAALKQKRADLERDGLRQQKAASDIVAGQKEQIKTLENNLKQKDAEIAAANKRINDLTKQLDESQKAFADLQVERDSLLREKDQMAALLKLNESGRIQDLISQNVTLAAQLRQAEERVKKLSEGSDADQKLYIEALNDLAIAKSQIGRLQTDRKEQDKRLSDLEARLKSEQDALASGAANNEEVRTLRQIISKQLVAQKRRTQAREELENAAKAFAADNPDYAKALDLMTGSDVVLTPEEQKLLSDRKADMNISGPNFARSPGEVAVDKRALKAQGDVYDSLAKKAYESGRLLFAKELYQTSIEENPGDTGALCKLGFLQMKTEDYPSSSDTFRRATEIDPTNPYAQRMLGYAQLMLGDGTGAEQSLLRAIEVAPDDAMSHVILGSVYMKQGRAAESESESRAAMMADPSMWQPYYNLAVFCSKSDKRKEEGKRHYMKALELGATPDFALEKKLGLGSSDTVSRSQDR